MKPKGAIQRRNRLKGQIAKAAEVDAGEAVTLATYGRIPTLRERAVWKYLSSQKAEKCRILVNGKKADYDLGGPAYFLCQVFLDAVNRRDTKALREIEQAVKKPQLYQVADCRPYLYSGSQDSVRVEILNLKRILEHAGKAWTVKALAGWLQKPLWSISIPDLDQIARQAEMKAPLTADSHADLRRLAKRLKFPLTKDKIGRPKKSDK